MWIGQEGLIFPRSKFLAHKVLVSSPMVENVIWRCQSASQASPLGLKILAVFAGQMRGRLLFSRPEESGTEIRLKFPVSVTESPNLGRFWSRTASNGPSQKEVSPP